MFLKFKEGQSMIIKTKMTEYPCFRAEQHKEDIHLFNESGKCFTILVNPKIQEVVGGEIEVIEAIETETTEDILNALLGVTV
jgi:hypothetical protein